LAGLEFRVGFADHIHRAFAFHDLAISVTALGGGKGRKDFHDGKMVDVFDCPWACRDAENRRRMSFVKQIPPNTRGFFAKFSWAENANSPWKSAISLKNLYFLLFRRITHA